MARTWGTSNANVRGNTEDRRKRKLWLLSEFGDGIAAMCAFGCGTELDFSTITVDRHPVAGCNGGRYVRGNIRPACAACNEEDGRKMGRETRGRVANE
jgi:hypothetical protein